MQNVLRFCKVRPVKSPSRAYEYDAGIDFYVPDDFSGVRLKHGESVLVPSGIKVDVPKGWVLWLENKSGVASRKSLDKLACVIDHGYKGEVHINIINNGLRPQVIEPGDKIIQGILLPIGSHRAIETTEADMWQAASLERGAGGFGSTGNK